jgi:hypothetical protein
MTREETTWNNFGFTAHLKKRILKISPLDYRNSMLEATIDQFWESLLTSYPPGEVERF